MMRICMLIQAFVVCPFAIGFSIFDFQHHAYRQGITDVVIGVGAALVATIVWRRYVRAR